MLSYVRIPRDLTEHCAAKFRTYLRWTNAKGSLLWSQKCVCNFFCLFNFPVGVQKTVPIIMTLYCAALVLQSLFEMSSTIVVSRDWILVLILENQCIISLFFFYRAFIRIRTAYFYDGQSLSPVSGVSRFSTWKACLVLPGLNHETEFEDFSETFDVFLQNYYRLLNVAFLLPFICSALFHIAYLRRP